MLHLSLRMLQHLKLNYPIVWDGVKIPVEQQCDKFGGESTAMPNLHVMDFPSGSDSIVLEYSDRDSKKMDNGGHGRMSYSIDAMSKVVDIPSVPGHSFYLPIKFTIIEAHRGAGWDKEGAYMPPCSGGNNHAYYVTIKTIKTIKTMKGNMVTAKTVLAIGKF
ncbi:hypothetical protein [Psychromonas sp. L1A2]|uniref:hypothetical protein n=1 Tax=Psychromonas sp. L1A2 TaxID=2686356 RepID=UPI001F241DDE|nr:hypothetical protein [Psychromonas sp. L1A2]